MGEAYGQPQTIGQKGPNLVGGGAVWKNLSEEETWAYIGGIVGRQGVCC